MSVRITPTIRPPDAVNLPLLSRMLSHSRDHTLANMPMSRLWRRRGTINHASMATFICVNASTQIPYQRGGYNTEELSSWNYSTAKIGARVHRFGCVAGEQLTSAKQSSSPSPTPCIGSRRGTTILTHTGGLQSWNLQQ